jgi:hypothetical protein
MVEADQIDGLPGGEIAFKRQADPQDGRGRRHRYAGPGVLPAGGAAIRADKAKNAGGKTTSGTGTT